MNQEKFKTLRTLLDSAGITVAEAAEIFKTSKPTVYHWCEGNVPSMPLVRDNALKLIGLIEKAVAGKDLPLRDVDPEKRIGAITQALRKNLN